MQLFALDHEGKIIFAKNAQKQQSYFCPECKGFVRVRGGIHRQIHFYHLEVSRDCRQSGKSLEHLNVQMYFLKYLPKNECFLEKRFPEINRIADVVWDPQQLIFEVQCSPISHEEVLGRNKDYQKLGYEVVWILHDQRFNQNRPSAAEYFLHGLPHFFTNINEKGEGEIYDQLSFFKGGFRIKISKFYTVDIRRPQNVLSVNSIKKIGIDLVRYRMLKKNLYFSGDVVDSYFNKNLEDIEFLQKSQIQENVSLCSQIRNALKKHLKHIKNFYHLIFQLILERACK